MGRRFDAWRRPIVPVPLGTSIVGAGALHGRVRDGNGWDRPALATSAKVGKKPCGPRARMYERVDPIEEENFKLAGLAVERAA